MIFPDVFIVKSFDLDSSQFVTSSESRNKKILTRSLSGHRWDARFRIDIKPWNTREARAVLFSLQEDDQVLTYSDPDWEASPITRPVAGTFEAGRRSIAVSSQGAIPVGTMFNFSNHGKLYMVTGYEVNTLDTLRIFPSLTQQITSSDNVLVGSASIDLELAPDLKRDAQLSGSLLRELSRINLRMVEKLA